MGWVGEGSGCGYGCVIIRQYAGFAFDRPLFQESGRCLAECWLSSRRFLPLWLLLCGVGRCSVLSRLPSVYCWRCAFFILSSPLFVCGVICFCVVQFSVCLWRCPLFVISSLKFGFVCSVCVLVFCWCCAFLILSSPLFVCLMVCLFSALFVISSLLLVFVCSVCELVCCSALFMVHFIIAAWGVFRCTVYHDHKTHSEMEISQGLAQSPPMLYYSAITFKLPCVVISPLAAPPSVYSIISTNTAFPLKLLLLSYFAVLFSYCNKVRCVTSPIWHLSSWHVAVSILSCSLLCGGGWGESWCSSSHEPPVCSVY